jgi:hypothetical protein
MVAFVCPYTTGPSAIVLLDLLVNSVKLMWMNVPLGHASMEQPVLTFPKVTDVNALKVILACSVRKKYQTVRKVLVLTGQCARICLVLASLNVCAVKDTKEKTVMLQQTHAQKREILAQMEPVARPCHKVDSPVSVQMAGKALFVKSILMIVLNNHACLEAIAQIWFMTSPVNVLMDFLASGVRKR